MGARFVRAGLLSVLLSALTMGSYASAQPPYAVHLEPSRLFNPAAESLLAPFDAGARKMSPFSAGVFNVGPSEADLDIADLLAPQPRAPLAGVNLPAVTREEAYIAPQVSPSIPAPELGAPSDVALAAAAQVQPSVAQLPAAVPPTFAPVRFGTYSGFTPSLQSMQTNVSVPLRVGKVHFNGMMSGGQEQTSTPDAFGALQRCGTTDENAACPYLQNASSQNFAVGTDFNVRAGNDALNLQLSSSVSHLSTGQSAIFPYVPIDPDAGLTSGLNAANASILQYAGVTDMVKHGVDARLAVPVNSRITVGLQYDRAHYQGDYGNSLLPGVDAYKDTYLGNVTYQLPNTSSLLTLSARQYRYQDSLSNFNLTQTRADLNFTVKF